MKGYISKTVAISLSLVMFVSASAQGLSLLGKSVAEAVEQVRRGHPGAFTDRPIPVKLSGNLSRNPETRGGLWSQKNLASLREKSGQKNCVGGGTGGTGSGGATTHTTAVAAAPGTTLPWESSVGGINTANGNKLTTLPLTSWKCRGGMTLDFTLYHNSQTNYNDELGYGWSWTYDIYINNVSDTTATLHLGNGLCIPFTRDAALEVPEGGNQTTVIRDWHAPAGIHDRLESGSGGTWTLTTKDQKVYAFNSSGFCTSITDRNGNAITITLNSANYATRVTDPTGRYIDISLDSNNNFTSISDPLGRTWSFTINASDDLSTVTWPVLNSATYTDAFVYNTHRITRHTDRRGKNWDSTYYTDGSINTEVDPLNHTTTYANTSSSTTITDALNHTTTYTYSSGKLASVTDPCNYSTSYTYDANRNVTLVTDGRGKNWTFTYNSNGDVLTKTDPLNHTYTFVYNTSNDLTSVTNPLSNTWTVSRSTTGLPIAVTNPLSNSTNLNWDSNGQLTSQIDPLSHGMYMSYDNHGAINVISSSLEYSSSATYNNISLPTSVTDSLNHSTSVAYDVWSRPVTISKADSSTISVVYNANGQVTSATNELGRTTYYTYDDAGRLTDVTNANSEVESYGYDNANRRTTVTNGRNKTRTYVYNNRGDVTSLTLPDNSVEQWSYNGNGDVTAYTNPLNQVIYYSYDDAGRQTTVDYPTGTDTTFAYDNANRPTQMVDATGTTSWTYDNNNRLTGLNTPQGNMTYTYDAADRQVTMVDSNGTTTYTYDENDRMTSLQNPFGETTSFLYDGADRMTRQTFASGAYTQFGYDTMNRQNSIIHKKSDNSVISSETYNYDFVGNLTSKTVDSLTSSYTYDNIDQLTGESRTGYVCTYTYDANGNRLTKVLNGTTESYTYDDADKMLTAGSKTYTYDAAGRTTGVTIGNDTTTLAYDYESRLTQITYPNQSTNTFTYNGLDTRVGKVDSSGTKTFKRDGVGVTADVISDGAAVYNLGISRRSAGVSTFFHGDRLGTLGLETNANQDSTATKQYDAFGCLTGTTGSTSSPFGFAGEAGYQEDLDSGLKLVGHRYYDSSSGRFLTRDPIGDGKNWYTYCHNNPIAYIDATGYKAGDEYGSIEDAAQAAMDDCSQLAKDTGWEWGTYIIKVGDKWTYLKPSTDEKKDRWTAFVFNGCVALVHSHTKSSFPSSEYFSNGDVDVADKYGIPVYLVTPNGKRKRYTPNPDKKKKRGGAHEIWDKNKNKGKGGWVPQKTCF